MDLCSFLQGVLEHLAAHTGSDHGVPVLQFNRAGSQSLRQLVHSRGRLHRVRTRNSSKVRDALDGRDRRVQVHTSGSKCADVPSHLGEVVDGLVGVGVQLVEGCINLLQVGAL